MTIDEAIKHCKEKNEELNERACTDLEMTEKEAADCLECATEHLQLATWLEELQEWRKLKAVCAFDGYTVYLCKGDQAKEEKPRGAWITVNFAPNELNCPEKSRFDFVKCPFCEVIHQGRHNFCSYCGADMREEVDT